MSDFNKITVGDRQCVVDLALQEYGCYEGVFLLLKDNAVLEGVNDVPEPGTKLLIRNPVPKLSTTNLAVVEEYKKKNHTVVSNAIPVPHLRGLYVEPLYWDNDYA